MLNIALPIAKKPSKVKNVQANVKQEDTVIIGVMLVVPGIIVRAIAVK